MKLPNSLPDSHFKKYGDKPVKIKPYNPVYKKIAGEYLKTINKLLKPVGVKATHIGATALGISGKGDVEFIVYPTKQQFDRVMVILVNHFKGIKQLNYGFAQFITKYKGYEIEVVVINDEEDAIRTKKLYRFFKKHPKVVKEYELVKINSAYSAEEYARAKDNFLRKIKSRL